MGNRGGGIVQYILTEEEYQAIMDKGISKGFRSAEELLEKVLNGERDLRISYFKPAYDDQHSPWTKLVRKLDKKG